MAHIFIFTFTITIISAMYIKFWKYKYWNRRGLAQFSTSLPFGYANRFIFHNSVYSEEINSIYNEIKNQQCRHGGIYIFSKPCYVPIDPQIIKTILTSNKCSVRKIFVNPSKDNLFNPIYYSSQEEFSTYKKDFQEMLTPQLRQIYFKEILISVKNYLNSTETFEISFPSSLKHMNAVIIKKLFFNQPVYTDKLEILEEYILKYILPEKNINTKYMLGLVCSNILKLFFARISNKEAANYFHLQLEKVITYVKEQNAQEETFLSKIMRSTVNETNLDNMLFKILTILLGSSEVVGACVSFCLYELAENPEIQTKLRLEIEKFNENDITLEQLDSMEYLDQVIKEIFRKYPTFPLIKRSSTATFSVPSSTVILDKETDIIIPVFGLHKDPIFFENPELFNPDRFNKTNIEKIIDSTYIPFGSGERNCIGFDLASIQIKLIIFIFLKKYKHIQTTTKLTLEPNSAITSPNEFVLKLSI